MSIFKSCDIRGTYGEDLLPEHAGRLGAAIAHLLGPTRMVIGGDGRLSTPQLKRELIASLVAQGCHIFDVGTLPTPAFYFARKYLDVRPGVMVTASHNPAKDNGFKIVLGALPVREEDILRLQSLMETPPPAKEPAWGRVEPVDILPEYVRALVARAPDLSGLRIVLDFANGMTALTGETAWKATQADVHIINALVDGSFPGHPPDPARPENLAQVAEQVNLLGADLGASFDGDGDRVAFVDEHSAPLSQDKAIALLARQALLQSGSAPIVIDQKCSRLVEQVVAAAGGTPIRELSGHTFIKTTFLKRSAPYAGEISGHHFFAALEGDDGLYAALRMAGLVQEAGRSLSALADEIPDYPITPDLRVAMSPEEMERVLADLRTGFSGRGRISTRDGFRVELDRAWGMARKSVTEAVLTLRFEGQQEQDLYELMADFVEAAPRLEQILRMEWRR